LERDKVDKKEVETPQLVLDTKIYIEMLSNMIGRLEKAKPKDRLEYGLEITRCLRGMLISIKGWKSWIDNLETLNALNMKDFEDFYPKLRKTAVEFLKLDVEVTERKLKEAKELYQKRTKQFKKKKKQEKATYVA